ncbi:hypothetical protein [Geminicoccus harenae]|uniref:hypothetical protein n=1 Tax=Geminicoccus harenae TaxID=2498453 RepID=UPI00168B464C|nr:hypothetical protein [Geminicoccus harenae]
MTQNNGMAQRWQEFRPSKTAWFWSCVGSSVATIVVGFWFGGWVTGGTATEMTEDAAHASRAQLAADVCVNRFTSAPDFGVQLATLKDTSSYQRDNLIEDAGWTKLGGMDEPVEDAARLCAETLAAMDVPAEATEAAAAEPATVAQ